MKKKDVAAKMARANAFEHEQNKALSGLKKSRSQRVKREGFKSESDYFKHTNPFKNTEVRYERKQKGKQSLNSNLKHKVDQLGQQSYKEENT